MTQPGETFGRYQLLGLLGRGGMGEVFAAHDTATDRTVAIKLLPPHLAQDREFQQRFQREARAAAGLNDPHVVPIHDYGEIDGRLYVDMRLIEGRDLGALTAENGGRLPAQRAVAIIEQVAHALDTAHRAGLVHRDVKPSNILVAARDFVYLIDFGIARAVGDTAMTGTGHTVGTLAYMAPERFNGITDARADIYALAGVLHECVTGQRPYPGDSFEQQLAGHLTAPPPSPSHIHGDIPTALDAVIARGLAKDPDHRYQTATELADAARAALGSDVIAGTTPAPTQRVLSQFDRPVALPPRKRVTRYAVPAAVLTALVAAYLIFVVAYANLPFEPSIESGGGTRVTLTARTANGAAPSAEMLAQAQQIIRMRARGLDVSGSQVSVDGDKLVVTVPKNHADDLNGLVQTARFYLRPVLQSVPAQAEPPSSPAQSPGGVTPSTDQPAAQPDPRRDFAERIAQEKKWRQSSSHYVQMIALQFEATRCDKPDILAGNDDPALPLVTCSADHKAAYLLAPSIVSGDQIADTEPGRAQGSGYPVVNLEFKSKGAQIWADYTASHIRTQVAFTLDSQVLSAPAIQEAIPGGRTQISGGEPPFSQTTTRQLAGVFKYGPLPVAFEASAHESVAPQSGLTMPRFRFPPLIQVLPAVVLLPVALGALLYLYRRQRRSD